MRADDPARYREAPCARKALRRPVAFPAEGELDDGALVAAEIVDLSYLGCRIELGAALHPGATVILSVMRLGTLEGQVRWSADGKAGLCFEPEADPPAETERRHERERICAVLSLRRTGRPLHKAALVDLSPAGCKVDGLEGLAIGERIWAKFDGLESLEGLVQWTKGDRIGVEFARPIHPAVFAMLVKRLSA